MTWFHVVMTILNTVIWVGVVRLMGSRINIAHQRIDLVGKRLDAQHTTLKLLVEDAIEETDSGSQAK